MLDKIANAIRSLTIDAVEHAGSGHPGLPMGCADLGAFLFAEFLNYNPSVPNWEHRDRLILSAGHGSLFLYTCLHLAGFSLSIEDLKQFRQFGSKTPSHPDRNKTVGIEASTGVDGQGVGFAVGQALGLKQKGRSSKVVVLAGDGCLMEGVSYEACSLAGHHNLDNLILIYDSNKTTLDGYVSESFSEDVALRFKSQHWDVFEIDGHNFDQIRAVFTPLRKAQNRPVIIIAHTIIGKGAPTKEGTPAIHGRPLGKEELEKGKRIMGVDMQPFCVNPKVYTFFKEKKCPPLEEEYQESLPNIRTIIDGAQLCEPNATRWMSHELLNEIAKHIPSMIVGSADLSSSDGTFLKESDRTIKYGVREFAMGTIAAGLSQVGLLPIIGTFLAFADYMRSAMRMAALMKLKVIYHLTHDSIFVGHDGPTHQPIEQLSSLRCMPNLLVIRPSCTNEVKAAWIAALEHQGPTALILSRQTVPQLNIQAGWEEALKGAYIVKKETAYPIEYLILATGSEVALALEVGMELGEAARVVSMPSWELFEQQSVEYKEMIMQGKWKISIEAGVEQGWHKYIGAEGLAIALSDFGECGSIEALREHFGYNKTEIIKKITHPHLNLSL